MALVIVLGLIGVIALFDLTAQSPRSLLALQPAELTPMSYLPLVQNQPTPTATATPTQMPTATPTSTATPTPTSTPSVPDIRIWLVGYAPFVNGVRNNFYEHIHLYNCDSRPINVSGWKLKSLATGDIFTFPSYVANPGCGGQVQFTVNTHVTGLENPAQGLFTWGQPDSKEEWPDTGGTAELYDPSGAKKQTCTYVPDPTASDVPCQ